MFYCSFKVDEERKEEFTERSIHDRLVNYDQFDKVYYPIGPLFNYGGQMHYYYVKEKGTYYFAVRTVFRKEIDESDNNLRIEYGKLFYTEKIYEEMLKNTVDIDKMLSEFKNPRYVELYSFHNFERTGDWGIYLNSKDTLTPSGHKGWQEFWLSKDEIVKLRR